MTRDEKSTRYRELLHAVQTGVAWTLAIENPSCPDINNDDNLRAHKHLRTGIDASKSDLGALANLLIQKGLINEDEYFDALLDFMQREKLRYEAELSAHFGKRITLE